MNLTAVLIAIPTLALLQGCELHATDGLTLTQHIEYGITKTNEIIMGNVKALPFAQIYPEV